MTRTSDVIVVGGGPSGLHLARRLAEKGLDVVVLEKKTEIGSNVICTGIVGKEVFQEFDLSLESILREIKDVRLVSPFKNSLLYRHPYPFACVVDREKFDKNMEGAARAEGVGVELGTKALDIVPGMDRVDVRTRTGRGASGRYSAKMAVISTGIDTGLSRKLGLGYPRRYLNGVQAELDSSNEETTTVFVGRDTAPGAFAWAVPVGSRKVRVGLLTEKNPRSCFQDFINRFYPEKADMIDPAGVQVKSIAQGLLSRTYADRVIVLGEAAGQVKTTTGGGIYFGLLCAGIAAEIIEDCFKKNTFDVGVLAGYEERWKKAIQREILIGYWTRKICSKLSDGQVERMFQLAREDGIIPLVQGKGNFDRHGDLILALVKKIPFFRVFKGLHERFTGMSLS